MFVLEVTMGIPKSPQAHTEVLKRSPGGAKNFASPPNYGYERENTIPKMQSYTDLANRGLLPF